VSRKIRTALIWVFLLLTLGAVAWFKLTQPRILVLHSYAPDYTWTRDIDIGLKRVLDAKLRYKVQWHYMDTKNHPDKEFKRKAGALARRAIEALHPNLVIAIDDDAQAYAVKEYAGKPDIAIVFAGINGTVEAYGYDKVNNATGIYERKPLLDLRRALIEMRGANGAELGRRIMHLGDQSDSVKADIVEIRAFDWAPFRVADSHMVRTFDEWKQAVAGATDKADVILISNYHNVYEAEGKPSLVAPSAVMQWTEANSRVPVVGLGGFMVEEGGMFAVGASGFEQGEITARMAIEVLDRGEIPKHIAQAGYHAAATLRSLRQGRQQLLRVAACCPPSTLISRWRI
jgi:hypothetical protein